MKTKSCRQHNDYEKLIDRKQNNNCNYDINIQKKNVFTNGTYKIEMSFYFSLFPKFVRLMILKQMKCNWDSFYSIPIECTVSFVLYFK